MSDYRLGGVGSGDEAVRSVGESSGSDAGKGYGFIVPDDPNQTGLRDVLLHVTSLRNTGRESAPKVPPSSATCQAAQGLAGARDLVDLDESAARARGAPAPAVRGRRRPLRP